MSKGESILLLSAAGLAALSPATANPAGLVVNQGSATVANAGPKTDISVSDQAILQWATFNIGHGETTTFHQPNAASIVWNRIVDQNPSTIFGNLNANGMVVLFNQSGFFFGPDSVVKVGGLLVTTAAPPPDLGAGGSWQFSGSPPTANIVNYGQIHAANGGSIFVIANSIENHGVLDAPGGSIGLIAGQDVLLSERPDGRGLCAHATLPAGAVTSDGSIAADAGHVALEARVVNVNGRVQANSVREHQGVIELVAADAMTLGPSTVISAQGEADTPSAGGQIRLQSGGTFADTATTQISVAGGSNGGDGGKLAISAPSFAGLKSQLNGSAAAGFRGGEVVIDPERILIGQAGSDGIGDGTVGAGVAPGTLELDVNSAFVGFSSITLQATSEIRLLTSTTWDLNGSTGISAPGSQLTLQSGGDIVFENNSRLRAGDGWSVRLDAGVNFDTGLIQSWTGSVLLGGGPTTSTGSTPKGSGTLEASDGAISIRAGQDVLVGSGAIRTVNGGTINVAAGRDINAGTKPDGFNFLATGLQVDLGNLGGIATGAGGNLTLAAGRNVTAEALQPGSKWPGATGAYGTDPGDVTIIAGGYVRGNFVVGSGVGRIHADGDAGTSGSPLTLNLIRGRWDVSAGDEIFLNEIRNPAGTFDTFRRRAPDGSRVQFLSDYSPDAALSLSAGQRITLVGANLSRTAQNRDQLPIYPPTLSMSAGAGGIELRSSIILYPSSAGRLAVTTKDAGSLYGVLNDNGEAPTMIMSDSGGYSPDSFFSGHADVPLHLSDLIPAHFEIAGNIRNLSLQIPKAATIRAGGDAYNFNYSGYNLQADSITRIEIAGNISYRANRTIVPVSAVPDFTLLDPLVAADPTVINHLSYDPKTKELTFFGRMTAQELAFLLSPVLIVQDQYGRPILDAGGNLTFKTADHPFVADADALNALYTATQDASLAGVGFEIAGQGKLVVSARNLDLGISEGIQSQAPTPALAKLSPIGPDIEVSTSGNLEMASTKIAALAPAASIKLTIGGSLDVGTSDSFYSDQAKGIFTFGGGSINIETRGNLNVNGSRIAAYDGGDINIRSLHGNIDAGEGGLGSVTINGFVTNPDTGEVTQTTTTIPGSGILATSLLRGTAQPGNITLTADEGDVRASKGGVVQLAFNNSSTAGQIIVSAGHDIEAGSSGIIGSNVKLDAKGAISGLVIASENVAIKGQSFSGTAYGGGNVSVAASGDVQGTVIGGGSVSVSGSAVSGAIVGSNVSTSGNVSAAVGVPTSTVASGNTKTGVAADEAVAKATSTEPTEDDEARRRRLASAPKLARTVGRVTVLLPAAGRVN